MAKKSDNLTLRQRESQRIMREKSARKKRQAIVRKAQIVGAVCVVLVVAGVGFWVWKNSMFSKAVESVSNGMYQITARAGFTLDTLYLEGRSRTPMEEISKAININKGDPILQLSLQEIKARLEAVGSISSAAVERELPNRLAIRIVEREPVALWQHQGKMVLVDDNGVAMPDVALSAYRHLPLIVGKDAPSQVGEVLALLQSSKALQERFAAAVRISGRRWNVHLKDGTQVKLPEQDATKAWEALAKLQDKQQLLDRDVKVIDLRVAGRLFIKTSPENVAGESSSAKET
ncbi:MAG: cell division protein FtsQ/DivIB [Alphaproteobacteria bacterium]